MHVMLTTPILNVSDLHESFAWFEKLGWEKRWDWGDPPDFGAVGNGPCEIFLCVDGQGCRGGSDREREGTWMGWLLRTPSEVDAAHEVAVRHGLTVTMPPTDEPWSLREFHLRHPDGHIFRVGAPLAGEGAWRIDTQPKLAIERVDVPVRLEKRLAAVLTDLAAHKGMSVSECLEETLLHTFEPAGGGVASPHTTGQMTHIRELKARHGIDYDTHASYRFVEDG
jgi:catechol 2,3-dioxygenase-like lactoylglutathione lyase family enzyme